MARSVTAFLSTERVAWSALPFRRRSWLLRRHLIRRDRCCLAGDVVILRDIFAHQVLVHPSDDVLQALDAMPRLAGTRELVALVGNADHDGRALQGFERAE